MPMTDLGKYLQENVETSKRSARICAACPLADPAIANEHRIKSIAGCDYLVRRKLESCDERLPVPFTDAKDEVDVFLQRSVFKILQCRLIERIATPEDHPRSDSPE